MQAIIVHSAFSPGANDAALKSEIAALRESLKKQRNRARKMWDACEPGAQKENRLALGIYTEKLLKGQENEYCG